MTDAHPTPILIIGGGHAAAQLCGALAQAGLGPQVQLVCAEPQLPYQRPPLSKGFLKSTDEAAALFRPAAWYSEQGIQVHLGQAATHIDRAAKTVQLASGQRLAYGRLVLATGAVARQPKGLPAGLDNVASLRSLDDAVRLRGLLHAAASLTVLGGGFIGLEIAATARALGLAVTLLEAAPRLLARSVSPELADHVLATHRAAGVDIRLGAAVDAFETDGTRLQAVSVHGQRLAVDLLALGVGALPDTALAEAAGLVCDNGVLVDAQQRTSDPDILAVGDNTCFPAHAWAASASGRLRLESVANANDQARIAAAVLQGQDAAYAAVPWFWSEQGAMRLQMAGLMPTQPTAHMHRRPGANAASFSLLHYVGDQLVCVESANAPLDHMAARQLLQAGRSPAPALACDPATPLKSLA